MSDGLEAAVRLQRGELALDVEIVCPPGVTCVMGPSGSGKSSLLAALAGLITPDAGRIALGGEVWFARVPGSTPGARPTVDGTAPPFGGAAGRGRAPTVDVPVHARQLAYVFQGLALFPHMSALGNVMYGMADAGHRVRQARAQALLDRVGVGHLARRRPRTFSGGEAQRVALARALARSPRLILLDEPFSALDRELRAQLIALVRELVAELGVPLVHVTHSVGEARRLADQVVRIERGKVVAVGTTEILANIVDVD